MRKSLLLILLLSSQHIFCQSINVKDHVSNVVFLAYVDKQGSPTKVGSGFLVQIDGVFHLMTAKHVITTQGPQGQLTNNVVDSNLFVVYKLKNGHQSVKKISDLRNKFKINWVFHPDMNVDIAMIPFDIDVNDDLKVVLDSTFLDTKRLFPTYDAYFVTFQPELLTDLNNVFPIFRKASICKVDSNRILLDAFAFPGNSGSPVFLKPSSIRYDTNIFTVGGDELGDRFIGIIGQYIPYQDIAVSIQTGQQRVVFSENSGIAVVYPVNLINEIIHSLAAASQIDYLKKTNKH